MDALEQTLLYGFVGTVGFQLACFAIAYLLQFDKITDLAGCANFIALAVLAALLAPRPMPTRSAVAVALVCASRLELGAFLLYRVLKRGKDSRFDAVRGSCLTFLAFWIWQMLWVYIVSLSFMFLVADASRVSSGPIGAADVIGWTTFVLGFALQAAADLQKNAFRSNPANNKKVCTVGVWGYSRHPNFCGEILMWWGMFVAGLPVFRARHVGYVSVLSPLFTMFVLLAFTGIPQAEGQAAKRWYDGGESQAAYEDYFSSTPPLWLFPTSLYRRMPLMLKRLLCFELPMYKYKVPSGGLEPLESGRSESPAT